MAPKPPIPPSDHVSQAPSLLKPRTTRLLPCQQNYCHHRFPRRETAQSKIEALEDKTPAKENEEKPSKQHHLVRALLLSLIVQSHPHHRLLSSDRSNGCACVRACVLALPCLVVDPPSERAVGPCPFCSGPEKVVISK